jgi:hypothetical protein
MSDKKACYEKCMEENYSNPRKCDDSEGNCKEAAAKHCRQQCGGMDEDVKDFFKNRILKQLCMNETYMPNKKLIVNKKPLAVQAPKPNPTMTKIDGGPGSGSVHPHVNKGTNHTVGKKFEVGNQTPQEKSAIQTSNNIAKKKGSGM